MNDTRKVISSLEVAALLTDGAAIVAAIASPHGFVWRLGDVHEGHPGNAARGAFVRADRMLDLGFRNSLNIAAYRVGTSVVSHEVWMRHLGHHADAEYPGFSSDPLDAFRHLASDLEKYGSDFLWGDGATIAAASQLRRPSGTFR